MDIEIIYFDLPHALEVHDIVIEKSGGLKGYDPQKVQMLESALAHIQNDNYYPTFLDKITYLLFAVNKNHAFLDGNKRTSLALASYFLEVNGYDYCIKEFQEQMEDIVVRVAKNTVSKDLLKDLIEDILMQEKREATQMALIRALAQEGDNDD